MNSPTLQRYVRTETLIGAVINAIFSVLFVFLIFSGQSHIGMTGEGGLLIDSVPQGLAIGLMGAFFPSFLTRKRIKGGQVSIESSAQPASKLPAHPFVRALLFALASGVVSLLLFVLLSAAIGSVSFTQALILKTVWGGLLGGMVSYIALQFALRDYAA